MNAFRFSLQKVLDWRATALDIEESRFKQQAEALADLERARAGLRREAILVENEVRRSKAIAGSDLAALSAFRSQMQVREKRIAATQAEAQKKLLAQQAVMLEARRQCRLLERLRERRLTEWKQAANKEVEEAASEAFLARWRQR